MKKLLFVGLATVFATAAFGQLVVNGDFETGDFTGWTIDAQSAYMSVTTLYAHSPTHSEQTGALTADGDAMHQIITDTSGQSYTLSFWAFQTGGGAGSSDVHFEWNGTDTFNGQVNTGSSNAAFTQYTANVVGTGSDRLDVLAWNSPAFNYIDDISLTAAPEPASMAALGIGLLAFLRRRRK